MASAAEKPKRPMSAYLLWLNSARDKIKAEHPGLKVTEVAKKAGEMWRALGDKTEWETRAAAAKEQYVRDLDEFNAAGGTAPGGRRGPKRARLQFRPSMDVRPKKRAPDPRLKKKDPYDLDDDDDGVTSE